MAVEHFSLPVPVFGQRLHHLHVGGLADVVGAEHARAASQCLLLCVAGDAGKCRIDGNEGAVGIGEQDAFAGVFKHGGGQLQRALGFQAGADVEADADNHPFAAEFGQAAVQFHRQPVAVAVDQWQDVVLFGDVVPVTPAD